MDLKLSYKNAERILEVEDGEVPYLRYPLLSDTGIVKHGFSTRLGGVSEGCYASMNLSFTRGDREEDVRENFCRIADAIGVRCEDMVFSQQTHTSNVRVVTEADRGMGITRPLAWQDVDGLVTDVPGICLVTFYADCVPLFFVDPVKKVIGLSHSGWRGTVAKIGKETAHGKVVSVLLQCLHQGGHLVLGRSVPEKLALAHAGDGGGLFGQAACLRPRFGISFVL